MALQTLHVGPDQRSLAHADGSPFFYLADTAWELFHRLDRAEADHYLRARAAQRFSVIQAVALAEHDGLGTPNRQGDHALEEGDPLRPVEAYFAHIDWVIDRAAELGLRTALLPTWGDKWNRRWGVGPEIFTPARAYGYGQWLGRRYRARPLIWVMGGDRIPERGEHMAIIRAMAEGVRSAGAAQLMTFHPMGQRSSGEFFHGEAWLDLNMLQSGHTRDRDNYHSLAVDYARLPARPCLDGEPGYEDHPSGFKVENGYLGEVDVRRAAYWALCAGACGHTYGCHDIWQFYEPGRAPITHARTPWRAALDLPGAWQMRHLRALAESRAWYGRAPAPELLAGDAGEGGAHIAALRGPAGAYAYVYTPDGRPASLRADALGGARYAAWWHDPRSGELQPAGQIDASAPGPLTCAPPQAGQDWLLVLEREA